MYIFIAFSFLVVVLYILILKPFIALLGVKLQFGKQAKLHFIPIFGDMWEITNSFKKYKDHYESIRRFFRENKEMKFLLMNVFNKPFIIIGDPEYNKEILINHDNFGKLDLLNSNSRLLGEGLLFQSLKKWKHQRNMLGKPFDYDKLKSRIPMMNSIVKEKISNINKYKDVLELTRSIAGEVVIQSFFGKEAQGSQLNNRDAQDEIVELFNDIVDVIFGSPYGFLKWQLLGEKQWTFFPNKAEKDINRRIALLYDFSKTVINQRINQIKEKGFKQNVDDYDFLDVHLNEYLSEKNEAGVTEREIISQFITLFFAGTDTTSSLAALCLFYLVKYPNVLTSLLSEINQVVGDGDVLDSQLPKLQELNSFIWEVLRSRNPASGPLVRVAKHDLMIKNLKVKKGWIVIPSNFVQQQTDKYFENYEEFDHTRFMKQNIIKDDNGYVNVPFSAGPRNCIGQHMAMMEIKIMLCHILRHYEIQEVPEKMKNLQWKGKFLYSFDPIDCIKLVQKH